MSYHPLQDRAKRDLEWDTLLNLLSNHAHSAIGAERCRNLVLETEVESARVRLQETTEMVSLLESEAPFPALAFQDLHPALTRSEKGASLEAQELRALSVMLGLSEAVRRCLSFHRTKAPTLASYLGNLADLSWVKSAIDRCVDGEGHILESATPTLRQYIQEVQELKQRIRHRLEHMLVSTQYEEILQEQYFAQRENRYVLPIKAEMAHKLPGIVHDMSASGATVFVEPRELVDLNNQIKVGELQIAREVNRIVQELSTMVGSQVEALRCNLEVLTTLDCIRAKAHLSRMIEGSNVALNEQGRIRLKKARHPLLALAKKRVVANDITLEEDQRVLVISGPNTGGKTVTLKLLGVFAFMVRAGLHPPCAEGSEMAFFLDVFADIGDSQDLTKDLSSFSAHMTNIIRLLEVTSPREKIRNIMALVLLDEVVGSTNPTEGAALAEALLRHLASLGLKVAVTTHYNSLKTLALQTPGFLNASLEFNVSTLAPTYRFIEGIPGGSSAIEIAGRLGMDPAVLAHALDLVQREDRQLDQILNQLHATQSRLHEELAEASGQRDEAARAAVEAREVAERLRATEREEQKKFKKKLAEELVRARSEIQTTLGELRKERTLLKAKGAKDRLSGIEQEAKQSLPGPKTEPVPLDELRVGDSVEISRLGTVGVLLESPKGKKRVRIRVGESELSVGVALLVGRGVDTADTSADLKKPGHSLPMPKIRNPSPLQPIRPEGASPSSLAALDLRGQTVEEAIELMTATLDQAALDGRLSLRVIHGHGTGKLKTAVREYLSSSPYGFSFRPGESDEGGDGVTVVELK